MHQPVDPSTMRGIHHDDKIMKKALYYELPELASPEQAIDELDVFFGGSVLKVYNNVSVQMFPRANALLLQNARAYHASEPSQAVDNMSPLSYLQFPLAGSFLQELVTRKYFIPEDRGTFDVAKADTHRGTWPHAPNLHRDTPPGPKDRYEEAIAQFLQKLLSVLNLAIRRAQLAICDLEFKVSAHDTIPGSSHKPDVVIVERGSNVLFETMRAIIEVKYCFTAANRKDTITAFADKSWFMLDACDQRVHCIGATLCGSMFTGCLLDRGGFVSTIDIDIEKSPLIFLQCLLALVIGTTSFDQEWSAGKEKIDFMPPHQEDWEDDEDESLADLLSDNSFSQDIMPCYTQGASEANCTFTILARIFSHRALTGRSTKVLIAERDRNSTFSDEAPYSSTITSATAADPFSSAATNPFSVPANPSSAHTDESPQTKVTPTPTTNPHIPFNQRLYLTPHEQVVIKDCWPTPDAIPEGYILEYLGGEDLVKDPWFNRNHGIPTKIVDRFVRVDDPVTGQLVVDSTRLHRRTPGQSPKFEHRVHYRLATEEVCVDLSWFSHRKEFFMAILLALQAHQFAVEKRSILHRDISPPNIWFYIRTMEPVLAVPDWPSDDAPKTRLVLLGDWGMTAPLDQSPIFKRGPTTLVSLKDTQEWVGYNICFYDRIGTMPFMATELLWDQWGDNIPHSPHHDLESFFWTTLWSICNFSGPYHQLREWPTHPDDSITATPAGFLEDPPAWLKPGNGDLSFMGIVKSRLSFSGSFDCIQQFIDPYWQVSPVIEGLREMFDIFLPANLAERGGGLETKVNFLNLPPVNHERMIKIVQGILSGLSQIKETPPSQDTIINRRAAWVGTMKLTSHAKLASYKVASADPTHQVFTTAMSLSQHQNARLHYQTAMLQVPSDKRKRNFEGETGEASTSRQIHIRRSS